MGKNKYRFKAVINFEKYKFLGGILKANGECREILADLVKEKKTEQMTDRNDIEVYQAIHQFMEAGAMLSGVCIKSIVKKEIDIDLGVGSYEAEVHPDEMTIEVRQISENDTRKRIKEKLHGMLGDLKTMLEDPDESTEDQDLH